VRQNFFRRHNEINTTKDKYYDFFLFDIQDEKEDNHFTFIIQQLKA